MKIFVTGPHFCDSFARNIAYTLTQMGHEVGVHDGTRRRHDRRQLTNAVWELAATTIPTFHSRWIDGMLRDVRDFRPALVLATQNIFTTSEIDALKRAARCPVFCWYTDAPSNIRNDAFFVQAYDLVFTKEPRFVEMLNHLLHLCAEYLPECCNEAWHKPHHLTHEQLRLYGCDIVAQGTLHPYRARFFDAFSPSNYHVRIWGSIVSRRVRGPALAYFQHRYIGETEKAVAFRAAKIFVDNMQFTELDGVNNSLFEAAGCGAFVMCDAQTSGGLLIAISPDRASDLERRLQQSGLFYATIGDVTEESGVVSIAA